MRLILISFLISLSACAPEKKDKPEPQALPLIAEIPTGCAPYLVNGSLSIGSHEFGANDVKIATAFDCGQREGKSCFYYLHVSALGVPQTDVRCN